MSLSTELAWVPTKSPASLAPAAWVTSTAPPIPGSTGSSRSRFPNPNSVSASTREARAVAALNHPHICQLYDVGPNYLVMEYLEGAPLQGPLPLAKALEYAVQILDALDAAHRKGITHRDLKPANILLTKQGIKLLDFGLAKHAGSAQGIRRDADTQALTAEGQILGTLQYMSPEQLQGQELTRAAIFSPSGWCSTK